MEDKFLSHGRPPGASLPSQRPRPGRFKAPKVEVVIEGPRRRTSKSALRPRSTPLPVGQPAPGQKPGPKVAQPPRSEKELLRRKHALLKAHEQEDERRRQETEALEREREQKQRAEAERQAALAREAELAELAEIEAKRLEEEKQRITKEKAEEEERLRKEREAAETPVQAVEAEAAPTKKPEAATERTAKPSAPFRRGDRKRNRERDDARLTGRLSTERRRKGKLTVSNALNDNERQRSHAAYMRSHEKKKRKASESTAVREKVIRAVQVPETIVVQELANRMAEPVKDVVAMLMKNGMMVSQNEVIDADTAELIIEEFGHTVSRVSDADVEDVISVVEDKPEDLHPRPPVIAVMGHVDHGKTSLLDRIRNASVVSAEAGGITQHIGAYQVKTASGQLLTFLDTPGHAAFTSMRARGAQVTDIVILVVAADDAVMPQTVEAINHAKAAEVPIIVAINKCDKKTADPETVRNQLLRDGVIVEKRSGDVLDVEVSAMTGDGVNELLDSIALQAELIELKANPNREAVGAVIEAQKDEGRGPVATILVRSGTLRKNDIFVVGDQWGKARELVDHSGQRVASAGPSTPVEVLGLKGTPNAGDILNVVETVSQAKEISEYRVKLAKDKRNAAGATASLELFKLMQEGKKAEQTNDLKVVVKADVQGSAEAITQALQKIGNDEVRVRVLHSGIGEITDTDIGLAEASDALVLGFNVRAKATAKNLAIRKGIDIRYFSVIYSLVDDVKAAASGLLSAEIKETLLGNAEILEVFKIPGVGPVAGCKVIEGIVRRAAGVRLLRDNVVIHEGKLKTLKRFKNEVAEVQSGLECGMAFEGYSSIRNGDAIEVFEREEVQRSL